MLDKIICTVTVFWVISVILAGVFDGTKFENKSVIAVITMTVLTTFVVLTRLLVAIWLN